MGLGKTVQTIVFLYSLYKEVWAPLELSFKCIWEWKRTECNWVACFRVTPKGRFWSVRHSPPSSTGRESSRCGLRNSTWWLTQGTKTAGPSYARMNLPLRTALSNRVARFSAWRWENVVDWRQPDVVFNSEWNILMPFTMSQPKNLFFSSQISKMIFLSFSYWYLHTFFSILTSIRFLIRVSFYIALFHHRRTRR